jgi:hypothetical protein
VNLKCRRLSLSANLLYWTPCIWDQTIIIWKTANPGLWRMSVVPWPNYFANLGSDPLHKVAHIVVIGWHFRLSNNFQDCINIKKQQTEHLNDSFFQDHTILLMITTYMCSTKQRWNKNRSLTPLHHSQIEWQVHPRSNHFMRVSAAEVSVK